jgi:hypothetical protein
LALAEPVAKDADEPEEGDPCERIIFRAITTVLELVLRVLDLIEGLDRGGRVVDRGGQRLDGDVDQKADRIIRVLLEGAVGP